MRTHVKEALASLVAAGALASVIHSGIWFTLFGTPDFTVIGYPFHYFWLVAGAPFVMFILYWIYFQYVTKRIQPEKDEQHAAVERQASVDAGGDVDD